jgi:hypothetical protein
VRGAFDERGGKQLEVRGGRGAAGGEGVAEALRRERVGAGDAAAGGGYFTCCKRFRNSGADS